MGRTEPAAPHLKRSLSLWQATLYGLGVTIGAGIYVMVGVASQRAGMQAPVAFLAAALLMACSAGSFAELAGRLPVAAGEAEYVRHGFSSSRMGAAVGLLVAAIAIVSAAAISVGASGYISVFVPLPETIIVLLVVATMGAISALSVKQAVGLAAVMTLVEIGGLLLIIGLGFLSDQGPGWSLVTRLPEAVPRDYSALAGVMAAVPLAVFAFIGFEGLANIAEEVREPHKTLPRAIFLTLIVSTLLYILVLWVSLTSIRHETLAASKAPLSMVFEALSGGSPAGMSAIAVAATLNGIIVQLIMASRVIYGLAALGSLPAPLAQVHPRTSTPVVATFLATIAVLILAVTVPLQNLADITAHLTLVVFALVNLALILIKRRDRSPQTASGFRAPVWMPWCGFFACLLVLGADLVRLAAG